jgi:hypothetical protein
MNTLVIDTISEKIVAMYSGPPALHEKNISTGQVAIKFNKEDYSGKKPILIDDEWQIINDDFKTLEKAKSVKLKEIIAKKLEYMAMGITVPGKVVESGEWVDGGVVVKYDTVTMSNVSWIGKRAVNHFEVFASGNSYRSLMLGPLEMVRIDTTAQAFELVEKYQARLDSIQAVADNKSQELVVIGALDDVLNYDVSAGWEALDA